MKHSYNKCILKKIFENKIKKNINKSKEFFLNMSDIPLELINNSSKITIVNNFKILIEGYKNVEEYYSHYIRIITNKNEIIIDGINLDIEDINDDNLLIKGNIYSLNFKNI